MSLDKCPSCLKPGEAGFCRRCTQELFGGITFSPFTDLDSEVSAGQETVLDLVKRSFLSEEVKYLYTSSYLKRLERLIS